MAKLRCVYCAAESTSFGGKAKVMWEKETTTLLKDDAVVNVNDC
jgi:hypothetical protein